jgi:prophage tail gpP-like protein
MSDASFLTSAAASAAAVAADAVTMIVGGIAWGGWEEVSIMRGVETVPSSFTFMGTERYPGDAGGNTVDIKPRTPCVIKVGADVVLTGYVDLTDRIVTPEQHTVEVAGRSKLADLLDCSGFVKQWQFNNLTLLTLAKIICAPFGISVTAPDGDTAAMPTVALLVTETGYEMLEETARYMTKLLYDGTDGNLIIASLGDNTHSSGVVEGQNVQRMRGTFNAAEMMTEIAAVYQDTAILSAGTDDTTYLQYVQNALATDKNWPKRADGGARFRPLLIISEQGSGFADVVPRRIKWEMGRRTGRAQVVTVTVDTWRDSSGKLWTPNWKVPVALPSLKLVSDTWLITSVNYQKDEQGTRAELTLMPPDAMAPMPQAPYMWDAAWADASSGTTGAQTAPTTGG